METENQQSGNKRSRRHWPKRLLALAFALTAALLWLNGPGFRWLAPQVAAPWLAQAGMHARFTVDGSITGGFSLHEVYLTSKGPLSSLSAGRLTPIYHLRDLLKGKAGGIAVHDADIRLDLDRRNHRGTAPEEADQPMDPAAFGETLRSVRHHLLPLDLSLQNIQVTAIRDGRNVFSLAPSTLRHVPGSNTIEVSLGTIRDANGRDWPAQQTRIDWQADAIFIDGIAPLPGLALRDFSLQLPPDGAPSASTLIQLDHAVFMLESAPGFTGVRLDLREGSLQATQVAQRFGLILPADGRLTSLTLNVDQLLPDPMAMTGEASVLIEDIKGKEWTFDELSLDLRLHETEGLAVARARLNDAEIRMDAKLPWVRGATWTSPREILAHLEAPDVPKLLTALSSQLPALKTAPKLPDSRLAGTFNILLEHPSRPLIRGQLSLDPQDPQIAAPLTLQAEWQSDQPLAAQLTSEGLELKGTWNPSSHRYEAEVNLDQFTSQRVTPWLQGSGINPGMTAEMTARWKGSGSSKDGTHHGSIEVKSLRLNRQDMPPLHASGAADYQWPDSAHISDLHLTAGAQSIRTNIRFADKMIELENLLWKHQDKDLARASARLPAPVDLNQWRESLASETRPLSASVESQVLPFSLLADWLPQAKSIAPKATGQLSIQLAGTFSAPEIRANLDLRALKPAAQPESPPADLKLALNAAHGHVTAEGSFRVDGFAPARLTATLPFRPAEWLKTTDAILAEPLTARADLPRIDVARFAALLPAANRIAGTLSGQLSATGPLATPRLDGNLELANATIIPKDPSLPSITGLSAALALQPEKVTLQSLKATLAGGTLDASGSLGLSKYQPSSLDFRLTARHLPIRRDESLILRSHADLRLSGPWETATLSGSVGVVDSLFYRDIELLPIGTPFTTPSAASLPRLDAAPKPAATLPEPFRNWPLNLRLRTDDPFLIRGNFATGRVDADVRIGGTLADPKPAGEATVSNFRAALPFSTLKVRSGKIRFDPANGFDPTLEIRGTAEPRPYRVSLHVYGRASDPQLLLTSSPPLPDNEIMTLLATGTTTSGLEDPQVASSRAMQLLAEEMRRGRFAVGKQLRPLLGMLDRVDFSVAEADPYTSEKFSTATLSLTDRWYLSAGMGEEGDSRAFAVWRLSFR